MKRRWILITCSLILALIVVAGGWFYYQSTQPLYKPGMVSRGENLSAPLEPPRQPEGSAVWLVEPGIELAHFTEGAGRDVLVLHGGPGQPFVESPPGMEALADRFRFHYYDQRGSGDSTRPVERFEPGNLYQNMVALDRSLGIGAQIADIERVRRILGGQKLILMGHSWGGFLASLYAAEFPDNVEALILVAPANTLVMPQPDAESDLFASVGANLPPEKRAEFDQFMDEYLDFRGLFGKSEDELVEMNNQFGEYYLEATGEMPSEEGKQPGGWMVWAQYVSMGQRHDYRPSLVRVGAPVLVLHGARDMQSESASRLFAEAFPNSTFVTIPDSSHTPFIDNPREFAIALSEFLDNLP